MTGEILNAIGPAAAACLLFLMRGRNARATSWISVAEEAVKGAAIGATAIIALSRVATVAPEPFQKFSVERDSLNLYGWLVAVAAIATLHTLKSCRVQLSSPKPEKAHQAERGPDDGTS